VALRMKCGGVLPHSTSLRVRMTSILFRRNALAFDDFAGLDAAGADAHAFASAVDLGLDGLEVYVPAAASGVVGVRDVVAELRAFAAKITFLCHDLLRS